jgi:phosphoribosylglycinamide formyltransferase-1
MAGGSFRVGVLVSGEGTNLQALLDGVHGRGAEIVAVGSDRVDAPALARARAAGVADASFPATAYADRAARDEAIAAWLEGNEVQLVVLAGYMALLDAAFVERFAGRLINVHPSLLPAFPGVRAIEQALDYGVKVFGVTVHLVDAGVDTGEILMQRAVELPGVDTADGVHAVLRPIEHELLCATVLKFAQGAVKADPGNPRRMLVD